jgi:hypothetical protein
VKPWEPVLARSLQSLKKASFHFLSYVSYFDYSSTLGSYNKAFCLMLDNSLRVIARMPCPLAGPSYMVTVSEVATLQFAKEVLKLPVPQVITWSGVKQGQVNPVGADFIIMEEVPGVCLGERWSTFESPDDVTPIMTRILDMETKFESLRFSRIGSLYFKEVVSADLQTVPFGCHRHHYSAAGGGILCRSINQLPMVAREPSPHDSGPWSVYVIFTRHYNKIISLICIVQGLMPLPFSSLQQRMNKLF